MSNKRKKKGGKGPTPRRKEQGIRFAGVNQAWGGEHDLPRLSAQLKWDDETLGTLDVYAFMGDRRIEVNTLWTDKQEGATAGQSLFAILRRGLERIALADESEAGQVAKATLEKAGLVKPTPIEETEVDRCPRCDSPQRNLHPAVQYEGEVQICPHEWHQADKTLDVTTSL
jgi:hypothetical protein